MKLLKKIPLPLIQLIDLKNAVEVKIAFVISLFSIFFGLYVNAYNIFQKSITLIQDIILCFIGGYFGLMGLVISGLAIIISLFNVNELVVIDQINKDAIGKEKKNSIDYINNFYYSIAQIAFLIVLNFFVLLLVSSDLKIINEKLFYVCIFIYIYLFVYNLFYVVFLSKACLKLFELKKVCGIICNEQHKKNINQNQAHKVNKN